MLIKNQYVITLVPALLILSLIAFAGATGRVSIPLLTTDVSGIANIHPLFGALSSLGILLWCVAAAVSFFAAVVLQTIHRSEHFGFLLYSALLSAYLMLDDLFLIHEDLAARYFGIDEKIIFLLLGLSVLVYLIIYRETILSSKYIFLGMALGFLAMSVGIDIILEPWLTEIGDWLYFYEDGAKWLGITCWCSYHVHTSHLFVSKALRNP